MLHDVTLTTEQLDRFKSHAAMEALSYSDIDMRIGLNADEIREMNWLVELVNLLEAVRLVGRPE